MQNHKILLVEDSNAIQVLVGSILKERFELKTASTLAEAKKTLCANKFDLLLLDIQLPDGCGFEFCETVRRDLRLEDLSIIFLTGSKTEIDDKVKGFAIGADDYILKPVEPKEFLARIEAKLRRKGAATPVASLEKADFRVDLIAQQAFVRSAGGCESRLDFTPIEFKLFSYFLRHAGQVFSREDLIQAIWGENVFVARHTLDTHISSLRKKMGPQGSYLRAVVKKGYCFDIPESEN